jgi:divalent metal cation (Fe/Co/Zn/Cd) transporter
LAERPDRVGRGTLLVFAASVLKVGLGYYLLRAGRRTKLLILEADGKHVLTSSWTSFAVVGGLGLVLLTHWKPFAGGADIPYSGMSAIW